VNALHKFTFDIDTDIVEITDIHSTSGLTGSSMPTIQMQVRSQTTPSSSSQFGSDVIVTSFTPCVSPVHRHF